MKVYLAFGNNGTSLPDDAKEWVIGVFNNFDDAQRAVDKFVQMNFHKLFELPNEHFYNCRVEEWEVK